MVLGQLPYLRLFIFLVLRQLLEPILVFLQLGRALNGMHAVSADSVQLAPADAMHP